MLIHRGTCTPMLIAALSTIDKLWKEPKCPSTAEWIKKIIYTMEYYLEMKKNDILPFATMWMELEGIMLSEISQAEKDRSYVFTHMWNLRNLTEDHGGREGEKQFQSEREASHKRLLNTQNKLRVDGRVGERRKWVMGMEEGTCWDEHWVLYVSNES